MDPISKYFTDWKLPVGKWGKTFIDFIIDHFQWLFDGISAVLQWLVGCGDTIELAHVRPLVDFLHASIRTIDMRGRTFASAMRLVRDWHGRSHTVEVTDRGFLYAGRHYRSLSEVARAITGARWSGPRFFGL